MMLLEAADSPTRNLRDQSPLGTTVIHHAKCISCQIGHTQIQIEPETPDLDRLAAAFVLPASGAEMANTQLKDAGGKIEKVKFVKTTISGYRHAMLIPVLGRTLTLPAFSHLSYRESLGLQPFGTSGC